MTFHVLYNDCHLEADTERKTEGRRKSDKGEGLKEGGGREWLRSPLSPTRVN